MQSPEIKFIKLPNGSTLEVSIYPGFLDKVKDHFGLNESSNVNDDHIRLYIYGAFKSALDSHGHETI